VTVSVSVNRIESLGPLGLRLSILSQELLDRHVPSTHSDSEVAVLDGHENLDTAKVVLVIVANSLNWYSETKLIQILSKHGIDCITLDGLVSVGFGGVGDRLFDLDEHLFSRLVHFSPLSLQTLNFTVFVLELVVQRLYQVLIVVSLTLHIFKPLIIGCNFFNKLLVLLNELVDLVLEIVSNLNLLVVIALSKVDGTF